MLSKRINKRNKTRFRRRNVKKSRTNLSGEVKLKMSPLFPKDVKMKPIQSRVIRYFVGTALANRTMTPESILASMLTTNPVNTNASQVFQSIRVVRISMYFVPTNNFDVQANSLTFRWIDQNLPDELITDRGTLTEPACIKVRPPINSITGMWYRSNSPTLATPFCEMSAPQGSIIDIEFQHILLEGNTGTVYVLTVQPGGYGLTYTSILTGSLIPDGQVSTFITTI